MKKEINMNKLNIRKKPFFMVISIMLFLLVGGSFAWYLLSGQKHEADTNDLKIMSPYFLYLLNPGDNRSLQFSVGNIHPGEVKQVVICVSNQKPVGSDEIAIDIAKESDFKYDLEFIYTENLALDYKVYELSRTVIPDKDSGEKIPKGSILIEGEIADGFYWTKKTVTNDSNEIIEKSLIGKNVSRARWEAVFDTDSLNPDKIQNKGTYILFQKDTNDHDLHLSYNYDSTNGAQYEYDYYLIEMSLKDGASFPAKETDLLYVVVNAKQPEPTKETTTETTTEETTTSE